jgi:hypothetical protein
MVDALADIRAAQREIWDAYTQLDAELKTADLSTGQRQEKEAELKQLRTEITASAQASNMARMGFDQLLVSGGARGAEAFVKESVSQLADLAWDIASAPASAQSRQDLLDRADALATLLGNPELAVDHYRNAYAQADALEQQGRLNDAEQIRAQATLDLLSMVAGGAGVAKAAVTSLPKVAELGKIVAKGRNFPGDTIVWSPTTDIGPLGNPHDPKSPASTFRSGTYTQITLSDEQTLYRVIPDGGNETGSYWTNIPPTGPLQSVIDSALDPLWGNTATNVVTSKIPAGTTIYAGTAAPQRGLVGGGNQIYIPKVDPNWIVK